MGLFYLLLFVGYLLVAAFVVWLVRVIFNRRLYTWLAVAFVVLFPTYDMIVQTALLKYYQLTRSPLQQIVRTVDAPGSVYWEDNVWPGYDENYRLWMIDHLLDGEHLSTLAMNGPDGKIYLYRYGKGDKPEAYTRASDLPPLNYTVKLNPIPLPFWQKPFIWADRMEITDNRSKERIAYSERYMGYSPRWALILPVGDSPFEGGGRVGDEHAYYFDERVLFSSFAENEAADRFRNISSRISYKTYFMRLRRAGKNGHD
ncbi:hypothetical protein [Geothermobacter hydrogeniphilus]|uniref:Uncharacterized protein n=1 Tax=Geothermobacter hydrogeniphilus TaxID=1969733 RepID=A0A1X0XHP5_9BACT|nr:hypothetical protein [Geothermobacter hydrogeniphilus]ORJ52420.1 hypothetical protein B5V00_16780 [Geothermobacter hydrogeniphilus]